MKKKVVSIMMTAALQLACWQDAETATAVLQMPLPETILARDKAEHIRGRKHKRICFQRSRGRGNYHNPYRMVSIRGSGKRQR